MFVAWSDGNFNWELGFNLHDHVDFIAEEGIIFGFIAPGSIFVRRVWLLGI
jgi:hypothetical protein